VGRRVAVLHPAIAPAAEKVSQRIEEGSADGNSSFRKTFAGFVNRNAQEDVVVDWQFLILDCRF
jgi:hypothetical protein